MAFTTVLTTISDVDDSIITLFDQGVILSYTPELVADQLANVRRSINGAAEKFTLYSNLAIPSALTEDTDPASVALVDTPVTITPVEEGNVVTRTRLAYFQTGGKVDVAAAQLVGRNMGVTVDYRAVAILEAFSTTRIYPNAASSAATLTTADVLDAKFASRLYNKLSRLNVPGLGGGSYFGIAHDDCLHDLRESLIPIKQYQDLASIMNGEVGMAFGIRWLRSSNVTVTADSSGTIDSYKVNVLGFNALGKAVSDEPRPVISGPFDKLGRFVNVGWYGLLKYGVVDTSAMVQGICASSVGAN
jgi:N4-gp56 family major capsid protein